MSGMSHSHDFFGNETTNADSTLQSLAGQPTTCHIAGDQAAYWVPTMYENGKVLPAMGILAYFFGAKFGPTAPLPYGLKIVAGGRRNTGFTCFDHTMPHAESRGVPPCSPTQHLAMAVHFPDCWNGRDLDSADHRSHMAYAEGGICPSTHPVHVAKLGLWVIYKVPGNRQNLRFSSGALETAHADFFNSFDPATQAKLHDFCITGRRTCYKQMWQVLTKLGLKQQRVVLKQDQS